MTANNAPGIRPKVEEREFQSVQKDRYYSTYVPNPLVRENAFRGMAADAAALPAFDGARDRLPSPRWDGHEAEIASYWKAWELAFGNLRAPAEGSGFPANYIDTAFNDCLFMWDSCFIMMFAKYGRRAFAFQRTLDNLYAKQHPDGFICRQIGTGDGADRFHRHDPASTGPNVLAWAEWEYFQASGDLDRLARVFPVLAAYHRWLRAYRTWPDGGYWSSGWGAGMDNQPRMPAELPYQADEFYHGHLVWVDACLQQLLSARLVLLMAGLLGRAEDVRDFAAESERLARFVDEKLWDEETAFYHDLKPDGGRLGMKSIGAYWALIAGAVPNARLARFAAHLENPSEFNRPHRIPSLSADDPNYQPQGDYWRGGVWMPTNYMVLRGLSGHGRDALAHEIARGHVGHVADVLRRTGTIWENYAPESIAQGVPAKPDFVGWSGLAPIAVLLEYVFGLRADAAEGRLVWDVRLLEEHGVDRYPFGPEGVLELSCQARRSAGEKPAITVRGSVPVTLVLRWAGGEETIRVAP
ncbi:hypothetical protein I8J29_31835 [Paenibacillus sp. MWE-103]|uniref:Mannosylglycerate hydrolase MGH1-like glycoside hydrolase domain-containing protein n=1 Tax=Paenibacillus artemisiicola TaxID=1172618 RepID=A0ABS3WKC3_9BACL|nr:trehalase family glycosidase [Paenibacillus artemisiicola]MBO7748771.1 hypothetical protein [Paenibacillus artemisiicola]